MDDPPPSPPTEQPEAPTAAAGSVAAVDMPQKRQRLTKRGAQPAAAAPAPDDMEAELADL